CPGFGPQGEPEHCRTKRVNIMARSSRFWPVTPLFDDFGTEPRREVLGMEAGPSLKPGHYRQGAQRIAPQIGSHHSHVSMERPVESKYRDGRLRSFGILSTFRT